MCIFICLQKAVPPPERRNCKNNKNYQEKSTESKGMHKKMGCKADGEDEYRSNLSVVRISSNHQRSRPLFMRPALKGKRNFAHKIDRSLREYADTTHLRTVLLDALIPAGAVDIVEVVQQVVDI